MRLVTLAPGEFYHVFNRGNRRQVIFKDVHDRARFLFTAIYFQSPLVFPQIRRFVSSYMRTGTFGVDKNMVREIVCARYVELGAFALMPNHFHLALCEKKGNGISRYMQRVLTSYTKYFNTKYNQDGHLFQGAYKAVHVRDDRQLGYLSAYIHANPKEIRAWTNKPDEYPWSSYRDYTRENRWGPLLRRDVLMGERTGGEYREFVETSGAKTRADGELAFKMPCQKCQKSSF